jgi:tRNA threonylcarbamoyladenosine biosynthesis protein TsaB
LSKDGVAVLTVKNGKQKEQAGWLHLTIDKIIKEAGCTMKDIKAVAVSNGPGSYTGLRIGLSAAKGLCYALQIPLITIGTLQMMIQGIKDNEADLYCPMIDARRMEVFTALCKRDGKEMTNPAALILDENSFAEELKEHRILFFGNGAGKFKNICSHSNAVFKALETDASQLAKLSLQKYAAKDFADLAYSEPLYVKEFFTTYKKAE